MIRTTLSFCLLLGGLLLVSKCLHQSLTSQPARDAEATAAPGAILQAVPSDARPIDAEGVGSLWRTPDLDDGGLPTAKDSRPLGSEGVPQRLIQLVAYDELTE